MCSILRKKVMCSALPAQACNKGAKISGVTEQRNIYICTDALLKKDPKSRNMTSQLGMEFELGYFRKACLDLMQIPRLCPTYPAVGGDH